MASLFEAAAGLAVAPGTRTVPTQQRGRALALIGDRGALRAVGRAEDIRPAVETLMTRTT